MISRELAARMISDSGDDIGRLEETVGQLLREGFSRSDWDTMGEMLVARLDVAAGHPERRRRLALLSRLPMTGAHGVLQRVARDRDDPEHELAAALLTARVVPQPSQAPPSPVSAAQPSQAPPSPVSAAEPAPVEAPRGGRWPRLRDLLPGLRRDTRPRDRMAETGPAESPADFRPDEAGAEPLPEASWEEVAAEEPAGAEPDALAEAEPETSDESRAAYPLIACNPVWVTDEEETVTVGLTPKVLAAVGSTGPVISSQEVEVDDLTVTVLLDPGSVVLAAGTERTHRLLVTTQHRFPTVELRVTAVSGADLSDERRIGLHFRRGDRSVGFAWRRIRVVDSRAEVASATPPTHAPDMLDLAALTDERPPDLVLAVYRGDDSAGSSYVWDAFASSESIAVPDAQRSSGIAPGDTADFATQTRRTISGTMKGAPLFAQMEGYGVDIARAIPRGIVDTIRAVAKAASGTAASVLLISEEASVPWELAVLREPRLETQFSTSPFLGAHVAISRWPLVTSKPRPTPRDTHQITAAAVLTAEYQDVIGWPRLEHAEAEAARVASAYDMTTIAPVWTAVRDCLEGTPPVDWVHVALHGQFDQQGDEDGLVLLEGSPPNLTQQFLTTRQLESFELPRRPFVFLNACQVGSGNRVLGGYSGMAVALLRGGATAVVAPQWNIDDELAGAVTDIFYESVLGEARVSVAEALRAIRATYTEENVAADPARHTPTLIAYQLFGHPRLRLRRTGH